MTDGLKFTASAEFNCASCGAPCVAGYADGEPCVLHSQPPCEFYIKTDVLEFMREARRKRDAS